MPDRAFWMIVLSPENFARTKTLRFAKQGMKSRHRSKAERMAPGDGLCWYVTGVQSFAGTATVTSAYFESHDKIWISDGKPDDYPWRVKIKKEDVLAPERGVPAASLVPKLHFVRKWPKASWHLAFQGNVHELPAADFALISRAVGERARSGA